MNNFVKSCFETQPNLKLFNDKFHLGFTIATLVNIAELFMLKYICYTEHTAKYYIKLYYNNKMLGGS